MNDNWSDVSVDELGKIFANPASAEVATENLAVHIVMTLEAEGVDTKAYPWGPQAIGHLSKAITGEGTANLRTYGPEGPAADSPVNHWNHAAAHLLMAISVLMDKFDDDIEKMPPPVAAITQAGISLLEEVMTVIRFNMKLTASIVSSGSKSPEETMGEMEARKGLS